MRGDCRWDSAIVPRSASVGVSARVSARARGRARALSAVLPSSAPPFRPRPRRPHLSCRPPRPPRPRGPAHWPPHSRAGGCRAGGSRWGALAPMLTSPLFASSREHLVPKYYSKITQVERFSFSEGQGKADEGWNHVNDARSERVRDFSKTFPRLNKLRWKLGKYQVNLISVYIEFIDINNHSVLQL